MSTKPSILFERLSHSDWEEAMQILKDCSLPCSDLSPEKTIVWVAKNEGSIIGTIGLEMYGKEGLLRSFSVVSSQRNQRVGSALYSVLFTFAEKNGLENLHLLTTTAEYYFSKKGFKKEEKEKAPGGIASSTEFDAVCPSYSVYMVLPLTSKK